jgi:UDP-N-acetylglucosamine--N-acetylmuramyl-(pentapeptide) pyrophosphoryl-undecaprenol N-acetylglucosamine transferase
MTNTQGPGQMQDSSVNSGVQKKLLLAASTGGHLTQLVRLAPLLGASDDSLWVTFKTPQSESLLAGRRVLYVPYVRPRDYRGVGTAMRMIRNALRVERFDGAVSTGAAVALAALPLARLMGVPALYIESVSRVRGPSLSGQILARLRIISMRTQHPSWANSQWRVQKSVFTTYERRERPTVENPSLFVTLGTIEGYGFDSLIDGILRTGLADERTVWQLGSTVARRPLPGRVFDQVSSAEFDAFARGADVVVSHAGVGSLLGLLDMGIYPVLAPRRKSRGEHVDDHQAQIAGHAAKLGIADVTEVDALTRDGLVRASGFTIAGGAT